jgi:hypothetical protein
MKNLTCFGSVAALALIVGVGSVPLSTTADAAAITLGGSGQAITYTGTGTGAVTVTSPTLTGSAFFQGNPTLGTYSIGAMSFTTAPQVAGLFAVPANTEAFTFDAGIDHLTGTITWNTIQDNTPQPKFFGTLTVTSFSGDAAFTGTWASNPVAKIDFTSDVLQCSPPSNCVTLDFLATTTASATATISSGEVAVPAPLAGAGLPGLVAACAGLLGFARRRRRQRQLG